MCGITALLTASALVSGSKVWKAARLSSSFPSMAVLQTHADLAGAEDQHKGGTISVLRMQNIYHRRQQWFVWGFPCNLEIQERDYHCLLQPIGFVTVNYSDVHYSWKWKHFFSTTGTSQLHEKCFFQHHQRPGISHFMNHVRCLPNFVWPSFPTRVHQEQLEEIWDQLIRSFSCCSDRRHFSIKGGSELVLTALSLLFKENLQAVANSSIWSQDVLAGPLILFLVIQLQRKTLDDWSRQEGGKKSNPK